MRGFRDSRDWLIRHVAVLAALVLPCPGGIAGTSDRIEERFDQQIRPILEDYCFSCHGGGAKKGGVALDGPVSDSSRLHDGNFWWAVLRNVRAGIMPPAGKPRPSDQERQLLEDWIKSGPFGLDPDDPDPGRVTVRRLNRVEYRNTIRDLMGVDFDTTAEFPPDDTGHGFDTIGDVLTLSPLLLEKYLAAARSIVVQAVPTAPRAVTETTIAGRRFRPAGSPAAGSNEEGPLSLPYYEPAKVSTTFPAEHAGHYQLILDLTAAERYVDGVNDYNQCRLIFKVDGQERLQHDFVRQEGRPYRFEIDRAWPAGNHELTIELQPLTPGKEQVRSLSIRINAAIVRGPLEERYWTKPPNYDRFFSRAVPADPAERRRYARELLGHFATRAFRRPVDEVTVDRLVALAERASAQEGRTFEAGIAQALTAVLASPRFLFREEDLEPGSSERYPLIDEYALASRLSYFLWSTMPDDELFRLAREHQLRKVLSAQVKRMLADPRSEEFARNFVGQWLQARDIETVVINAFAVVGRDAAPDPEADRRRARFRELNRKSSDELTDQEKKELEAIRGSLFRGFRRGREFELTRDLRRAMRRETEMLFEYIVHNDRSLMELLDSDYTFLNEPLARQYGISGVKGVEMRKVSLPPEHPRGGVLTQGTVLIVTSNPDRTSPVKRGLFLLDNILGTPPAPPPPDIPPLEAAVRRIQGKNPTLREALALHRKEALCSSCHNRMDPLGLALENFDALGRWREMERKEPIDASGRLITGESFHNVRELKRILVKDHRRDFYRCLSEKLLTYSLGRGLGYSDVGAVDQLVERIERENGRATALITGVIESAPFQKRQRRNVGKPTNPSEKRALLGDDHGVTTVDRDRGSDGEPPTSHVSATVKSAAPPPGSG
jgi:hypothetical protein